MRPIPYILRFALFAGLSFVFLAALAVLGAVMLLVPALPSIESLRDVRLQVPLRVYSREGALMAEFGEMRRTPVTREEVPDSMVKAFLAAEDDRFYEHPGVDWQGLARAAVQLLQTGEKRQGGSTITMQVARNFFLSSEKTYLRKASEILLALKIERELSKDEILELYLNKIYLGQRAYGVGAAAQVYYGAGLDELDLARVAMIAGLPKAPSSFNPVTDPERALQRRSYVLRRMRELGYIDDAAYEEALQAPVTARLHGLAVEMEAPYVAEMVRSEMVSRFGQDAYTGGYQVTTSIDCRLQGEADKALRATLFEYEERHGYRGPESRVEIPADADEPAWEALLSSHRPSGPALAALVLETGERDAVVYVSGRGLAVIDWEAMSWARPYIDEGHRGPAPEAAADVLAQGDVVRARLDDDGTWRLAQRPVVQGALLSLRPGDGSIIALAGGYDFYASKYNRVMQARRQPGSSFKPFIYSAALEQGFTPASIINDAPVVFDDEGLEATWRPENFSGKFYGPTRLRVALTHSRNLVSIRLLRAIGVGPAIRHIEKFGFDPGRLPRNLSLALGSGTVTPFELARGYAVLANGGYRVEPGVISRIALSNGEVVWQASPATVCRECEALRTRQAALSDAAADAAVEAVPATDLAPAMLEAPAIDMPDNVAARVIDERNAWQMTSLLRDVVQYGTGRRARELDRHDLSGKTGTTNDQKDAWFSGYNHAVVTTVWTGFDKLNPLGRRETGAKAALPMWIRFMRAALEGVEERPLPEPPGMVTVRIDPETGLLASADRPDAVFETFRIENVPQKMADKPAAGVDQQAAPVNERLF